METGSKELLPETADEVRLNDGGRADWDLMYATLGPVSMYAVVPEPSTLILLHMDAVGPLAYPGHMLIAATAEPTGGQTPASAREPCRARWPLTNHSISLCLTITPHCCMFVVAPV